MLRSIITAAFATGLLALSSAVPALAQDGAAPPREATVMVTGEGKSSLAPDIAIVTLSVTRQAETAADALSADNKAMADVIEALKSAGIADKDLQTSDLAITPLYRHEKSLSGSQEAPKIAGYQVSNQLTVKVRDLTKIGALIDQSVKLGVNEGGNIVFSNDNPDPALEDARKAAVADAIAKAKTLTAAAGVALGRVIEINENMVRPMPQPLYRAAMMKEMADAPVPVQSGENTYSVTVNLTYAIAQ